MTLLLSPNVTQGNFASPKPQLPSGTLWQWQRCPGCHCAAGSCSVPVRAICQVSHFFPQGLCNDAAEHMFMLSHALQRLFFLSFSNLLAIHIGSGHCSALTPGWWQGCSSRPHLSAAAKGVLHHLGRSPRPLLHHSRLAWSSMRRSSPSSVGDVTWGRRWVFNRFCCVSRYLEHPGVALGKPAGLW